MPVSARRSQQAETTKQRLLSKRLRSLSWRIQSPASAAKNGSAMLRNLIIADALSGAHASLGVPDLRAAATAEIQIAR